MRALILTTMFSFAGALAVAHADPKPTQTVRCIDGTQSKAGRGACVRHGGVMRPGRISTAKLRTPPKRDTTVASTGVRCADGTLDRAGGRAACSRHGGIAPLTSLLLRRELRVGAELQDDVEL